MRNALRYHNSAAKDSSLMRCDAV